jgi:pre-rRNA-processing protein TSR4
MVTYDSDSSGDLEDYTETTTLLGYASKEGTDDIFSQLGGLPVCLGHCNGCIPLIQIRHG